MLKILRNNIQKMNFIVLMVKILGNPVHFYALNVMFNIMHIVHDTPYK